MIAVALDFLALGATRWLLRDLAVAMGHEGAINHQALTREVLAGADAWQGCDRTTAVNRLRAGFEVLTQARERFYPVDAYLVDLCLLDPAMPGGVLAGPLDRMSRSRSWPRPWRSRTRPVAIPRAWTGFARRSTTAGWMSRAGSMRRPKTCCCRWSRSSGNFAAAAKSIAHTWTSGTSRPSRGGGSGCSRNCRRSPSGSGSATRCTWVSTPAASRSAPRSSGSGRAPTGPAWRPCCDRRWRPIGRRKG